MHELPDDYLETVDALHRLTVYVVSPAQRLVNGEIILRSLPGGFGTFEFGGGTVVRIEGRELVIDGDRPRRAPITTLRAAAELAGIEPDVGQADQFDVPAPGDLDELLHVGEAASADLARWYAFVTKVLETLRAEAAETDDASPVRIWPEHFDAAIDLGAESEGRRATYGGSPADGQHAQPYLYASPWARTGRFVLRRSIVRGGVADPRRTGRRGRPALGRTGLHAARPADRHRPLTGMP